MGTVVLGRGHMAHTFPHVMDRRERVVSEAGSSGAQGLTFL